MVIRLVCSKAPQPLTHWRAKDKYYQQARIVTRHHRHSLSGEPNIGMISKLELQQSITALTFWRAKDRHHQQARIAARNHNHSQAAEPRIGIISRLELQQGTTATHTLESQGQTSSAG